MAPWAGIVSHDLITARDIQNIFWNNSTIKVKIINEYTELTIPKMYAYPNGPSVYHLILMLFPGDLYVRTKP